MKNLKKFISLMIVAIFALTGTLMFTGCKKDELSKEQKIEVVKNVLNDTITKLEIAQMFEEGDSVQPKDEVKNSVFTEFGDAVVEGATDLETLTSKYLTYCLRNDSEVELTINVSNVILETIQSGNFEFDQKIQVEDNDDEIYINLVYNNAYFVVGVYLENEVIGFYKFNYSNNSIISVESFEDNQYDKIIISTDISKRALDAYISILKRTVELGGVNVSGYLCNIYSEEEGKCFTAARDMIMENPESIIQFVVADVYREMNEVCKNIIDANQALLESLN